MDIPPEPPPCRTAHTDDMSAEEHSSEGVMDQQGYEGEERSRSRKERKRGGSTEGKRRCREESREVEDPPGVVVMVRLQAT